MRSVILSALAAVLFASPAFATQGIVCSTIEGPERVYSLMAGTHAAATWSIKEQQGERWIDREIGQHWIDDERLYVDIVNGETLTRVARIEARKTGNEWVGAFRTETRTQSMVCQQD